MKQHLTPEFYLKGFTSDEDPKLLWRFEKGIEYRPGKHRKFNPALLAPKAVGWEEDFYETQNFDRVRNNTLIERDVLMRVEQGAHEGIDSIRNGSIPQGSARSAVAQYIAYLYRRVKAHREELSKLWPNSVGNAMANVKEMTIKAIEDPSIKLPWREGPKESLEKIELWEKENHDEMLPSVANLGLQHPLEQVEQALYEMKWILIINKSKYPFVTSDNPVYFHKAAGLKNSDLTVPFSKKIMLAATWRSDRDSIIRATENMVRRMNRRTISDATEFAYASIGDEWVLTLLNRGPYPFERLH
jgi:hypothetical protein